MPAAASRSGTRSRIPLYGYGPPIPAIGYTRYSRQDAHGRLVAQVLVVPSHRVEMTVKAANDALLFDFRSDAIRPDLSSEYRRRPGLYLHHRLEELRANRRRSILFNGNNVGYWGNQFVIDEGRLIFKPKGPIFDDGQLRNHINTGYHAFFLGSNGFRIADLKLLASSRGSDVDIEVVGHLPDCGISGLPLLRSGRPVWKEYGECAWDPGLLFDLGALRGDMHGNGYAEIRKFVRQLLDEGAELARHPMTVIGLDGDRNIVLLVAERSQRSRGMTVAEAANILSGRFNVREAIVLGAAGDAQLATTEEGFLIRPYVAEYARTAAEPVRPELLSPELDSKDIHARPVPSYVRLEVKPA